MESVVELLEIQSGVVSRRQLMARGHTRTDVARKVRQRELTRVHEGVTSTTPAS